MNTKLIISCMAASALLIGGCTTQQTNKPPPGAGQVGPVSDCGDNCGQQYGKSNGSGSGSGQGGSGSSNGRGNGRGNGSNGSGSGSNGGYGQGGGSGGSGNYNRNNQGGSGGYNSGNNGRGQGGSGNSYGSGGGGRAGQGGFGTGSAYGGNTKSAYSPADLRDPRSILAQRIIYFDYDKSAIKAQYRQILDAHGSLLADFPELNVRLEGHADERGSREYNVALSERRAYSVLDYLKIKGVKANQADIVGYGEEVPAAFGHGEGSWHKNRRVEIIYAGE